MLKKLQIFLKDTDCKVLIKYDGERDIKKYTIKLLYNNLMKGSIGRDTDYPSSVLVEIAEREEEFPLKEVTELLLIILEKFIHKAILKFGIECIALIKLEEKDEQVYYSFYIQTVVGTKHASSIIFSDALEKIFENKDDIITTYE